MTETSLPSQTALAPSTTKPALVLPKQGVAKVKSVTSGDTVVLLGKPPQPNLPCPEVLFTLEGLSAPIHTYTDRTRVGILPYTRRCTRALCFFSHSLFRSFVRSLVP
jgi:hypothetical protein